MEKSQLELLWSSYQATLRGPWSLLLAESTIRNACVALRPDIIPTSEQQKYALMISNTLEAVNVLGDAHTGSKISEEVWDAHFLGDRIDKRLPEETYIKALAKFASHLNETGVQPPGDLFEKLGAVEPRDPEA